MKRTYHLTGFSHGRSPSWFCRPVSIMYLLQTRGGQKFGERKWGFPWRELLANCAPSLSLKSPPHHLKTKISLKSLTLYSLSLKNPWTLSDGNQNLTLARKPLCEKLAEVFCVAEQRKNDLKEQSIILEIRETKGVGKVHFLGNSRTVMILKDLSGLWPNDRKGCLQGWGDSESLPGGTMLLKRKGAVGGALWSRPSPKKRR